MELTEVKAELQRRYFQSDPAINAVIRALALKQNCILYGPPGHAKSGIVETALKLYLGEVAFYQQVYQTNGGMEMPTEPFVGALDLKRYREDGTINYQLEHTIYMEKEYAILEEGLDAPPYVLETMKQPLMSKVLCINNVCSPVKLQSMFICTNHNPVEWAGEVDSYKALLKRFPHRAHVEWSKYDITTWDAYLTHLGRPDKLVAAMLEKCHKMNYSMAPREALAFQDLIKFEGLSGVETFDDMHEKPEVYEELKKMMALVPFVRDLEEAESLALQAKFAFERNDPNFIAHFGKAKSALENIKGIPTTGVYTDRMRNTAMNLSQLLKDHVQKVANATEIPKL